jgi:hypothetical protein
VLVQEVYDIGHLPARDAVHLATRTISVEQQQEGSGVVLVLLVRREWEEVG